MLSNEFPPLGGGMATVLDSVLRECSKLSEIEIDLVTGTHEKTNSVKALTHNVRIFKVPLPGGCIHHASNTDLLVYSWRAFWMSLQLIKDKPYDVALAWSTVPAGLVAFSLKKLKGTPYALRLTGPDIPGFENRYRHLYPLLLPFLRTTWRNAGAIIAKCDAEVNLFNRSCRGKHVTVIPNASCGYNKSASPRSCPQKRIRLLCVARLIERKGHRFLFEALAQLKEMGTLVSLTVVGVGDLEVELRALSKKLGLCDFILFRGYVEREVIEETLEAHDVFVLPSLMEAMSVAALEALESGMPLVLTRGGGAEEIVQDGLNGFLVEPGSSTALAKAILRLDQERSLITAFSLQSLRIASSHSAKITTEKILATVSSVKKSLSS
jgi:phosphatidylinositol alpha-1,6-mannosyltransferase